MSAYGLLTASWQHVPQVDAFDGEHFLVCEKRCDQCLFSKAKIVDNKRREDILKNCATTGQYFICHKSAHGKPVVCRGFFDDQPNQTCQVAGRLRLVHFVNPETSK